MADKVMVVGNWKANGTLQDLERWAAGFDPSGADAVLCVPHPYLSQATRLLDGKAEVGAQDVAGHGPGSHTGDTTAGMAADCGASFAIVGHSERRAKGEDDQLVRAKVEQAMEAGLHPILCVGESLDDREAGDLRKVLQAQVQAALSGLQEADAMTVAYEPVWAIGTGVAATEKQAAESCRMTRELALECLAGARIKVLYGGSVNASNAVGFVGSEGIDGLLVGGASLEGETFSQICAASAKAV